jgi:uncharacterized membrane protein
LKIPLLPNPWVILGVVLALAGAFGYGAHLGRRFEMTDRLRDDALLAKVQDAAQTGAATEIAKIKPIHRTTTQVLEREIVNSPLPPDCRISDVGLRSLNAIIENRPFSAGDRVVPEADPAP